MTLTAATVPSSREALKTEAWPPLPKESNIFHGPTVFGIKITTPVKENCDFTIPTRLASTLYWMCGREARATQAKLERLFLLVRQGVDGIFLGGFVCGI
jgi:hypothetical protein